jgi:hypothetical protein
MRPATDRLIVLVVVLAGLVPSSLGAQQPAGGSPAELARLERVEDLTEDLANDLLELSLAVRDRDRQAMQRHFADAMECLPLPCTAEAPVASQKWLSTRKFKAAEGAMAAQAGADYLADWLKLLSVFKSIEDVRFKAKEADFDPAEVASARTAFNIIGRNRDGQREWLKGSIRIKAVKKDGHWQWTRSEPLSVESMLAREDLFSEVASPTGVQVDLPPYKGGYAWYGAAAGDLNNDGLLDVVSTTGGRTHLFINVGGTRFEDHTTSAGLDLLATGLQPLLLDVDGDGDLDIFFSAIGPQVLLENRLVPDGKLSFEDVSASSGVARDAIGFSAVAADFTGDGKLDIYVCSYNHYGRVTPNSWTQATNGTPNLLFVAKKDGGFEECAARWQVDDRRWSYAAAVADVNRDGRLDLAVANDFGEKGLFINHGDRFVDEAAQRGALDPGNGMGLSFGDFDNDGHIDLHASNMSSTAGNRILGRIFEKNHALGTLLKKLAAGNNLLRNKGDGTFEDVTAAIGGFSGGWAWGGGFIDFDNDGWSDFFTPNGFVSGPSMKDT